MNVAVFSLIRSVASFGSRRACAAVILSMPIWIALSLPGCQKGDAPTARPRDKAVAGPADLTVTSTASASAEGSNRNPGYIGPEQCRECHAARVAEFSLTNHHRTCRAPAAEDMPEAFHEGPSTCNAGFPGVRFEMQRIQSEWFQTTIRTSDGMESRTQTRIDLVLGAGTTDDVYLSWDSHERIRELPVAWLWPRQEWGVSHFCTPWGSGDFSRAMTVRCMECHTTWMQHEPGTGNLFRKQDFIPGVTCERCHGPAALHAEWHRQHPNSTEPDSIVRPALLSREQQIGVCTQCHSNAIVYRNEPFSHRPNMDPEQSYRLLTIACSEDEHVANQIDSLRKSKCFAESGTMTCTTCHNPHRRPNETQDYSAACHSCHTAADCADRPLQPQDLQSKCVECHMPQRIRMNVRFETAADNFVPAARRCDHRIGIHPEATDEVRLEWLRQQPDPVSVTQAERLAEQLSNDWIQRAIQLKSRHRYLAAIGSAREAAAIRDSPVVRELLNSLIATQSQLNDLWGQAAFLIATGQHQNAVVPLRTALALRPTDGELHAQLGTVLAVTGQISEAEQHLRQAAELDPNSGTGPGVLGRIAWLQEDYPAAIRSWLQAQQLEPRNAQIEFDLGEAHLKLHNSRDALKYLRRANQIDPLRVDIASRLTQLLMAMQLPNEAQEVARRVLRNPENSESVWRSAPEGLRRLATQK